MTNVQLKITPKELEALMWGCAQISDVPERVPNDPQDPLAVLLALGYARDDIMEGCTTLEERVFMCIIREPLEQIERDILRVIVESCSWVRAYIELGPAGGDENDARATLRGLAGKLEETFGIECNFIANN